MVGQATFAGVDVRGYGEFTYQTAVLDERLVHSIFHLGADDMFAKGGDKVLDSARDPNPVRGLRHKLHRVANAIAPEARVGVQNQGIVYAQLDFANA